MCISQLSATSILFLFHVFRRGSRGLHSARWHAGRFEAPVLAAGERFRPEDIRMGQSGTTPSRSPFLKQITKCEIP